MKPLESEEPRDGEKNMRLTRRTGGFGESEEREIEFLLLFFYFNFFFQGR